MLHAIIPAGGAGTRLWPLSRQSQPKFLLDPLGRGQTLLQETFDRLREVALTVTVVTGPQHHEEVRRQLPDLTEHGDNPFPGEILIEPSPRDSMAAIGLATYIIRERYGDGALVGSFAADHVIEDRAAFEAALSLAEQGARSGLLTTLGIVPTEPSTAFGYIEPDGEEELSAVRRFVEKPDEERAAEYVAAGYLWNAGIFVAEAGTIAAGLAAELPAMDTQLRAIARRHLKTLVETGENGQIRAEHWDRLTRIAIDYALAEPMAARGQVAVVRTSPNLGWSDIGDFAAVARLRGNDPLILSERHVEVLGLTGIGVVDTPDALLVLDLDQAQEVKEIVDRLRETGTNSLI